MLPLQLCVCFALHTGGQCGNELEKKIHFFCLNEWIEWMIGLIIVAQCQGLVIATVYTYETFNVCFSTLFLRFFFLLKKQFSNLRRFVTHDIISKIKGISVCEFFHISSKKEARRKYKFTQQKW